MNEQSEEERRKKKKQKQTQSRRKYYLTHKQQELEYARRWQQQNREHMLQYWREYYRRHRAKYPDLTLSQVMSLIARKPRDKFAHLRSCYFCGGKTKIVRHHNNKPSRIDGTPRAPSAAWYHVDRMNLPGQFLCSYCYHARAAHAKKTHRNIAELNRYRYPHGSNNP
jgi:hypothetical protein